MKKVKKLQQKKYRTQSYLIEGWHLFEEAVAAGAVIRHIFVLEVYLDQVATYQQVIPVSPAVLKDLADSPSPQGLVAVVDLPNHPLPERLTGRFLVLEDVQDPGNVGNLIRTADAAGFDAVLVSDKTADIYNLKTLRSMQGSHFHLPIFRLPMGEILDRLDVSGVPIWATSLSEDSVDYRQLHAEKTLALVMGNEGSGISQELVARADQLIHIPMPGQAESLNVASAGAIIIFSLI